MRWTLMIGLLAATVGSCPAQDVPPSMPFASPQNAAQQTPTVPDQKQTIVVPAGTSVPVKITHNLWSKTAHAGDTVHAVTVFPVTVGDAVAIPAGTYVEGVIDKAWRRPSASHPAIQMHFTQLLFANGYTVSLESGVTEVLEKLPGAPAQPFSSGTIYEPNQMPPNITGAAANSFPPQQPPQLPPPPHVGPNMGVVIGASLAGTAALVITLVVLGRRSGGYTLLDAGSQIDLTLQIPLTLDAQQVAAAIATPNVQ
jgi:hypothetical protein